MTGVQTCALPIYQRLGGALMWSGSMIIDAIWLAIAVSDWLKDDERRSREIDEEIARGK